MNSLYHIINFENNSTELIKKLSAKDFNFDGLFQFASTNLIIPTLYNAIKAKELEDCFPEEFLNAITYINNLNEVRNKSILSQMQSIAKLFNANAINYVFLKSNALLASSTYRAVSDRMIGDIDILVAKNHLLHAKNLLVNEGYTYAASDYDLTFLNHRHLPRLVSKKTIAAIELHSEILSKKQNTLCVNAVLKHKTVVNGIAIPNKTDCLKHSILSHQINDLGFLKWDFNYKTLYDFLALNKNEAVRLNTKNKYFRRFFLIKQLYLKDSSIKITFIESIKIKFLKWRLNHLKINNLYLYFVAKWGTIKKLPRKFWNLFRDKNYRIFTYKKTIGFFKKHIGKKNVSL